MFVCQLSGSGFESCYSHLTFGFCACFGQGGPWRSGGYGVWIGSGARARHCGGMLLGHAGLGDVGGMSGPHRGHASFISSRVNLYTPVCY